MAYSLAAASMLCTVHLPLIKTSRARQPLQVTSGRRYNDEGMGGPSKSNIVDANLHVLMMRIAQAKNKEIQLQKEVSLGWNYASDDVGSSLSSKIEKECILLHRLLGIVASTLGLTILTSTFGLYIISLIILHSFD